MRDYEVNTEIVKFCRMMLADCVTSDQVLGVLGQQKGVMLKMCLSGEILPADVLAYSRTLDDYARHLIGRIHG